MARRRRKKFKLPRIRFTRKQRRGILAFIVVTGLLGGGLWFYSKTHKPPARPKIESKRVTPRRVEPPRMEPLPVTPRPVTPTRYAPRVTFVIDDIGAHDKLKKQLAALGSDVTYAILPLLPYSRYFGQLSKTTGAEVILHLPLDTVQDMIPGRGLIVGTMSEKDILDMLARDLDSVPYHIGVNNHMGSRGTTDREMMTVILRELKRRGLFFLDSYTTKDSVVPEICRAVGLPVLSRGVFLDNVDSKESIRAEIQKVRRLAIEKGAAIAIGHYRKNTLEVLAQEIPRLRKTGIVIVPLREQIRR
ncbi:MAG: divergent polysaccharide deacetylase family protein [Candidatus Omnitrophica bacterium]|nr:divergent polysaccharide deacetylase family protein [Candidatus Omnitrophota bacterium]